MMSTLVAIISAWCSSGRDLQGGHAQDAMSEAAAGGAIAVRNASTIQIITSAFAENQAENGGAVYLETCGKASLADNTFTSNRANKQGGGLFQTKCSGRDHAALIVQECVQTQLGMAEEWCCFTSSLPPRIERPEHPVMPLGSL